jgi:hypothetical protein
MTPNEATSTPSATHPNAPAGATANGTPIVGGKPVNGTHIAKGPNPKATKGTRPGGTGPAKTPATNPRKVAAAKAPRAPRAPRAAKTPKPPVDPKVALRDLGVQVGKLTAGDLTQPNLVELRRACGAIRRLLRTKLLKSG